mmetsp:Transcript_57325/g.90897  ORF Transcript_57325/g.90897 Transcript_57325/m.90897 type:complete len:239 (-) Transcript_57325:1161-1877(-)
MSRTSCSALDGKPSSLQQAKALLRAAAFPDRLSSLLTSRAASGLLPLSLLVARVEIGLPPLLGCASLGGCKGLSGNNQGISSWTGCLVGLPLSFGCVGVKSKGSPRGTKGSRLEVEAEEPIGLASTKDVAAVVSAFANANVSGRGEAHLDLADCGGLSGESLTSSLSRASSVISRSKTSAMSSAITSTASAIVNARSSAISSGEPKHASARRRSAATNNFFRSASAASASRDRSAISV